MRKPNPRIYLEALKEASLIPEETLFIDDMIENIEAAKVIVMNILHTQPVTLMENLPRYLKEN